MNSDSLMFLLYSFKALFSTRDLICDVNNRVILEKLLKKIRKLEFELVLPHAFFLKIFWLFFYMFTCTSLHLEFTLPCTEDVPTCGDSCDKVLECGIHKCSQRCHRGPCEICRQVSVTVASSHCVKVFKHCVPGTVQVF